MEGLKPCSGAFTTIEKQTTNNVQTQHKHMYSLYIGSLCDFTGVPGNLNAMKHSTELCFL